MNLDVVVNEDNPSAYNSGILVHNATPSVHAPELDTKDLVNKGKYTFLNQWTLNSHLGGKHTSSYINI